jgi:DNA replication protein DnaC
MLDPITKKQISKFVIEYLQKRVPNFQKKGDIFSCPFGTKHSDNVMTAHLNSPTSGKVHCYKCGELGDIFSLCRNIDFPGQELEDEDIADYLCQELKIKTDTKINEWLEKYQKWGWSLVPVEANSKRANIEKDWQNKIHKNIDEWRDWLSSGINVGLLGGKISNVTLIDIDTKEIPEDLKKYIGETLTQTTLKGFHLIYQYDADLPSMDLRDTPCKLPIEIRSDGGFQTVIYPSIVDGKERSFNDKEPLLMPNELKQWLMDRVIIKDEPKEVLAAPAEKLLEDLKIKGLDGKCNSSFIKVAGLFRKQLNVQQTEYVLSIVNDILLDNPLPKKDLKNMMKEIQKYSSADVTVLQKQVTDYLLRHEEASARDLVECLKMERKDIQEVLAQLIQDNKVYKQKNLYKIIKDVDWRNTFIDDIKTLSYNIPYFDNYAIFREGDMIVIGGNPGTGKTHLAMNFVKKFVEQGIMPYYYGTESKSRYLKIAMELGMKEGDFWWATGYEPSKVELKDNSVSIIDWLDVEDFTQTAQIFKILQRQLDKHNGLLIVFSQLNTNETFYAENQLKFYCALAAKYLYGKTNGVVNNEITSFRTEKIRESKSSQQYLVIPTRFDPITKKVELR